MSDPLYSAWDILFAFLAGGVFMWFALVVVDEIHKHLPW